MISRFKPTYANVVATLALATALGGGAYAAVSLPKNSVGSKQLKNGAVISSKLKNGAVTGSKVARNAITGADIKASTVGTVRNATHALNSDALGGSPPSFFQRRLDSGCPAGEAIQSVAQNGASTCSAPVSVSQMMGGSIGSVDLTTCACYLAPLGLSPAALTPTDVSEGLSGIPTVARHLAVSVGAAPGSNKGWFFQFWVNNAPNAGLSCKITDVLTSCTDDQGSASIPAGATVALAVTAQGGIPSPSTVRFGWTAGP